MNGYSFRTDVSDEVKDFYKTIKRDIVSISNDRDVEKLCLDMHIMTKEVCRVFFLDTQNNVIDSINFLGTTDRCSVYPRDIFQHALAVDATHIIMAHNHPAGSSEASLADWTMTENIATVGKGLGIKLLDHIILYGQGIVSMRSKNEWKYE